MFASCGSSNDCCWYLIWNMVLSLENWHTVTVPCDDTERLLPFLFSLFRRFQVLQHHLTYVPLWHILPHYGMSHFSTLCPTMAHCVPLWHTVSHCGTLCIGLCWCVLLTKTFKIETDSICFKIPRLMRSVTSYQADHKCSNEFVSQIWKRWKTNTTNQQCHPVLCN